MDAVVWRYIIRRHGQWTCFPGGITGREVAIVREYMPIQTLFGRRLEDAERSFYLFILRSFV